MSHAAPVSAHASGPRLLHLPEHRSVTAPAQALQLHDPRSRALLAQVDRIARSEAPVLLSGETGTGKELVARRIHTQSGRSGPFVAVNCGALSETLIDAELFGHEAGAFTGANCARAGWFEAAQGGTLFLDEIGDLPLAQQVKLLRVLQERQVVRLGARRPIALDVRLVTATHVDLREAVQAQRFRADLYWRLGVALLALAPLRERRGDILPLARHFIGVYAPRLHQQHARLDAAAEAALCAHAWPGNVRELENVIHFALIVAEGDEIGVADLRLGPALQATPAPAPAAAPPASLQSVLATLLAQGSAQLFHEVEATLLRTAYAQAGTSQAQAARLLGVTRHQLRTLLRRHALLH